MPQSRKWQLTINNPAEKGITHETLRESLSKFTDMLYWCMCDETGSEGTYHIHVYFVLRTPTIHKLLCALRLGCLPAADNSTLAPRKVLFPVGRPSGGLALKAPLAALHDVHAAGKTIEIYFAAGAAKLLRRAF